MFPKSPFRPLHRDLPGAMTFLFGTSSFRFPEVVMARVYWELYDETKERLWGDKWRAVATQLQVIETQGQ
jgi:hypothetical protein